MRKTLSPIFLCILSLLIPLTTGFLGALVTTPAIPTWYATLQKPVFTPPNWLFGPAWTTLYIFMGISLYLVWRKWMQHPLVPRSLLLFGIQLIMNLGWSIVFFGLKSPLFAFVHIIILWCFIILTIISFFKISRVAGLLLIPYLLWVTYASILNGSIVFLNR